MSYTDKDLEDVADNIMLKVRNGENIHDVFNKDVSWARDRTLEKLKALVNKKLHDEGIVAFDYNNIKNGDLVDFGSHGTMYVADANYRRSYFWATRSKKDRFNPDAEGWAIYKAYAEEVIEPASNVEG